MITFKHLYNAGKSQDIDILSQEDTLPKSNIWAISNITPIPHSSTLPTILLDTKIENTAVDLFKKKLLRKNYKKEYI